MQVSRYTLLSRRRERIAKSAVWFAVVLTLLILAWIVTYVMVRGFVSNQERAYDVADFSEESISFDDRETCEMKVIVNKRIRVKDLTMEDLRVIYTKSRPENWGHYSLQDMRIAAFAPPANDGFGLAAAEYIAGAEEELGSYVHFAGNAEEVVRLVADNREGIGYVPADLAVEDRRVNVVPIRRVVLAVHPGVKAVVDNMQLLTISTADLEKIFSGDAGSWKDLGGHDTPIRPVLLPDVLERLDVPVDGLGDPVRAQSFDAFARAVQNREGAAGLCYYDDALDAGLATLEISRKELRGNLTIPFLLESPARSGRWGGISTIIINTLVLILFTLLFAAPVGVLAAIYLVEYAKQGRLVTVLRTGTETLAGVPSIIFGLFGNIFFVNMLGMGIGFISSTLTVTMMILPTIIRTSEEALKSVPMSFREGSLALGATKLQTVFKVVLPAAVPGILTGLILGVGRVVGETAVLLYTLGSNYELVRGPSSSARVLSLHLYFLFSEAISFDRAFATGAILIFIVLIVNYSTTKLIGRAGRMSGNL